MPTAPDGAVTGRRTNPFAAALAWWWRVSTPPPPPADAPFDARERARRARTASTALLGFIGFEIVLVPICLLVPVVAVSEAVGVLADVLTWRLCRRGRVDATGVVFVAAADIAITIGMLGVPGGQLNGIYVAGLDLYVVTTLVAACLLPPRAVFGVALLNCLIVIGLLGFQPHTTAFGVALRQEWYLIYSRPIALELVVAAVSYGWTSSMLHWARRADHAEEIVVLRLREAARTHALEKGMQQLLQVHVDLANGQRQIRAPMLRGHVLFPLSASLNVLVGRLDAAETRVETLSRQAQHLSRALSDAQMGRPVRWPAAQGTPLDPVILQLKYGPLPTADSPSRPRPSRESSAPRAARSATR